jgi:hypothetical protein
MSLERDNSRQTETRQVWATLAIAPHDLKPGKTGTMGGSFAAPGWLPGSQRLVEPTGSGRTTWEQHAGPQTAGKGVEYLRSKPFA